MAMSIESINGTKIIIGKEEKSKYDETRKRLSNVSNRYRTCSDKEIIEYLSEEIEEYRERIKEQNRIIDELHNKTIQGGQVLLDTTEEIVDDDIVCIKINTYYADGKPIEVVKKYEYKQEGSTCPPIEV